MADPQAPTDAKPVSHIRTYAMDAAALGGQPSAQAVPAPLPKKEPAKPVAAPAQPAWAPIPDAPSSAETRESILTRLKKNAVPAAAPAVTTTSDSARTEVLNRLKEKAVAPKPAAIPEKPVSVAVPTKPPAPAPNLPPLSKTPRQENAPIHTYKTDFVDRTKQKGASPISVLATEQDAGTKAPQVLKPKKQTGLVLAAAGILLVAGIAVIAGAYAFVTGRAPIPAIATAPSLIVPDERARIEGEGSVLISALASAAESASLEEGGILVTYVTNSSTTQTGIIDEPQQGGALISALHLNAPEVLLRNIEPESTVGAIRADGETRPFFIFRVSSYERTFAGMLDWEATMDDELSVLYPAHSEISMSTSTPIVRARFIDAVVANRNVREFIDSKGDVLFLYGYRDKETLVIARSSAAFAELIARMNTARGQ